MIDSYSLPSSHVFSSEIPVLLPLMLSQTYEIVVDRSQPATEEVWFCKKTTPHLYGKHLLCTLTNDVIARVDISRTDDKCFVTSKNVLGSQEQSTSSSISRSTIAIGLQNDFSIMSGVLE